MLLANLAFISLRVLHRIHTQFAVLQSFETLSAQALSMGFPRGWPLESMCYAQAWQIYNLLTCSALQDYLTKPSPWHWCRVDLEKHVLCTSIVFALTPTASSPVHCEKMHHAGGVKMTNIKMDFDTLLFPLGIGCTTHAHFSASADYRKNCMILNELAELLQV